MSELSPSSSEKLPIPDTFLAAKTVPLSFLPKLRQRADKLNRRAEDLGCPAISLTLGAESINRAGKKSVVVTISAKAPALACGWYLLAYAYNLRGDGRGWIFIVPGRIEMPDEREMATIWRCDHCSVRKQSRREAFVFRDEAGKEIVVGNCCIGDFVSPATLVWTAQVTDALNLSRFKDVGGDGPLFSGYAEMSDVAATTTLDDAAHEIVHWSTNDLFIDTEEAVAAAACAIRHFGWSGSLGSSPSSLASHVGYRAKQIYEGFETKNGVTIAIKNPDVILARATITWAREEIAYNTSGDDHDKLRIFAQLNWIFRSEIDLAASMIKAYQEVMGRAPTGERRSDRSRHVGIIGQRGNFIATVDRIIDLETRDKYGITGTRHVHLFRDHAGNVLKWTAYSQPPIGVIQRLTWRSPRLIEGQVYELRDGTVLMHEDWRGVAQTVLGKCTPKLIRR